MMMVIVMATATSAVDRMLAMDMAIIVTAVVVVVAALLLLLLMLPLTLLPLVVV
jgi:hypothetical protein